MNGFRFLKRAAVGLACAGMIVPQAELSAATPQAETTQSVAASQKTLDLELGQQGLLQGQVLNASGKALEGQAVSVRFGNKEIARTTTDSKGRFAVKNLRSGSHQIIAAGGFGTYRLWNNGTAPQNSRTDALVVSGKQVVRGNGGLGVDLITITSLTLAGVSLGYGISNNNKLDDLEDQLKDIQNGLASP